MKCRWIWILGLCVLVTGCSGAKEPRLLDPVGETTDSAKVIKGEMYDIAAYDSAVTSEFKEVKLPDDAVIKDVNVQVGGEVSQGSPILTLDNESTGMQNEDIDSKIAKLQAENEYLNQVDAYDLQILELELQKIKEEGGNNTYTLRDANDEVNKKKSEIAKKQVDQQKTIAELQMAKADGVSAGGEVLSPWDGTIVYLNAGRSGSVVEAGTVVAIVAKKDSKILLGDYIERETVKNAHRIYARIGTKEYDVTNVPYEQFELNQRLFYKLPLFSTFYMEEAPEITTGMFASVVVITNYVDSALQIPENALLSDEEGYYVYKKDGKEFKRQNVKTGHMTQTAVEIKEGLKEGDEVYVKP